MRYTFTKRLPLIAAVLLTLAIAGCTEKAEAPPPKPHALTADAIGRYCGMNVLEHGGPKGQILLKSLIEPVWFSSARDAIAFTMMPEEPKDIAAIYVSDMAKAPSWDDPGPENWVDAKKAYFVVGSSARGDMGADEIVPFSDKGAAERFVTEKGGRIVSFSDIPASDVLSTQPETAPEDGHKHPTGVH